MRLDRLPGMSAQQRSSSIPPLPKIPSPTHRYVRFLVLCALLAGIGSQGPTVAEAATAASDTEQLIVFLGDSSQEGDRHLDPKELAALRELSTANGLEFVTRRASEGSPEEVRITPLIVFQNHRGRSIYQGRYTHLDRVANFIRTSRWFAQEPKPLEREDVLVRHSGRTTTAIKLKVTPLTGTLPGAESEATSFQESFQLETLAVLHEAFETFRSAARVQLARSDRTFYFDFYPYRNEDGQLFVSYAIFSQFDCHQSIYDSFEAAESGRWENRAAVFQTAAKKIERALEALMLDSTTGDDYAPVPSSAPVKTWKQLGLSLPPAPPESQTPRTNPGAALVGSWVLAPRGKNDPPRLQFQFPSPLDSYSGEMRDVSGELQFSPVAGSSEPEARSLEGRVVVQVKSITMGDEYLDDSLLDPDTLHAEQHPESSFVVERVETDPGPLRFGELRTVVLSGVFTMKGVTIPLTTRLNLEPIATDKGEIRLRAVGTFQIRLAERFGIAGPDGPTPANDTLDFRYDLRFAPAGPEAGR